MTKTSADNSKNKPAVASRPVVPSVIAFGADLAESGLSTSFDLMQEARSNLRSAADATIAYADNLTKTAFDFARAVVTRCDQLAIASLEQGKVTALDVVAAARNTSSRAASLASGTAAELVGADAA